jgi:hypothetical protein
MRKIFLVIVSCLITAALQAQSVGIGTATPDASALLHLESTSKGLLLPVMSTTNRTGIAAPAQGLMLYDFNTKSIWMKGATDWQEMITTSNNNWFENGGNLYRSAGFVGIGTANPYNKLQIHNNLNDSNFLRLTNNTSGNGPADGLLIGARGAGAALLNLENGSFYLGTNNDSTVTLSANGRVGIGTATPGGVLQVSSRVTGTVPSVLIVDSNTNNGGSLKLRTLGNTTGMLITEYSGGSNFNADQFLDIKSDTAYVATFRGNGRMGINNLNPLYVLDVGGDVNTTGRLLLSGNAGTAGQVLTSNGASDPSWQTQQDLYPGAFRAMIPFTTTGISSAIPTTVLLGTAHYNLNTTAIAVTATGVTINTTGLYQIEGKVTFNTGTVTVAAGGNPYGTLDVEIDNGVTNRTYNQINGRIDQLSVTAGSIAFRQTHPFKFLVHITAGSVLSFTANIFQYASAAGTPQVSGGYVSINRVE